MGMNGPGNRVRASRIAGAAFLATALAAPALLAGGLVPTAAPPIDPHLAAQLVISEVGPGPSPQKFAIGGRFVGDLDGDGSDDIALPSISGESVELYFGNPALASGKQQQRLPQGDTQLTLPQGCRGADELIRLAALGDLDGDGLADLGVSCFESDDLGIPGAYRGAVAIYWGRAAPWPAGPLAPDLLLLGAESVDSGAGFSAGERPGRSIVGLGDVDGDGFGDLLVTGEQLAQPEQSIAWLFRGGVGIRTSLQDTSDSTWVIEGAADLQCLQVLEASPLGDVDGGGQADFALVCPEQIPPGGGSQNAADIGFSVFLGESVSATAPGTLGFQDRDFSVQMLFAQSPRGLADAALGNVDGSPGGEFSVVTVQAESIQGQVVQGHPEPWTDVTLVDPYPPFRYDTNEENPAAVQLVAVGSVVSSGPAVWLRIGEEEDSRIGLLRDLDPSQWAQQSNPPFLATFAPPQGVEPSSAERLAIGGRGDFDGDGRDDLLIIAGYDDNTACDEDECSGAWLVLCGDLDNDGVSACAGDCDDRDVSVSPVLTEQCDELDHDCDGVDGQLDADEDGFASCAGDCDDTDPERFPGADEACGDGVDRDCDGLAPDDDQDGDESPNCEDCQPWMATVNPEAEEICDGLDTDCNGSLPGDELDIDEDGFRLCEAGAGSPDCDDLDPNSRPLRFEDCTNGLDDDCDGVVDEDEDQDGDNVRTCEGDCLDSDPTVFPGAEELCDGLDNNCNGTVDDARDLDGDGYSACQGDCEDGNPDVRPGAAGVCSADLDSNCDGLSDFQDNDGDGFTACGGDCNDVDPGISPRATDWCDRLDNNCDGTVDEFFDQDQDGWATCLGDCDDTDALRRPQPLEPDCEDDIDGDCDGRSDGGDSDCPSVEPLPEPLPRPYGFACADCQGNVAAGASGSIPVLLLVLLLAVRRRRLSRRCRGSGLLALTVLLLVPSLAIDVEAARKERALVVYMSPHPDIRHMVEAREALPRIDAVDVLHSSELFDAVTEDLVVVGARTTVDCPEDGSSPALQATVDQALEQIINLDNIAALRLLDDALARLACLDGPLPPRVLPTLLYYRGVVDHNLGQPEKADQSFKKLLGLAPDYEGDPNFPPMVNARLERAREELGAQERCQLLLFSEERDGLRLDGRRIDPDESGEAIELWPGLHIAQLRRKGGLDTVVLELEPGATAVVLPTLNQVDALRQAARNPAARAYAVEVLGMAAAEVDVELVVVLDLYEGQHSFEYRPNGASFSFDSGSEAGRSSSSQARSRRRGTATGQSSGTVDRSPSSSGTMSSRRLGGARTVDDDRLRLRLSGGYLYVHPFSYAHVPLDVTVRLWKGLCLDLGGEWSGSGGETGLIGLPGGSVGLSYRLSVADAFQLRFGALGRISADRQEGAETRPLGGWAVRVGGDILPPTDRLLFGFDVQGGMLGRPFYLSASFGVGLRL